MAKERKTYIVFYVGQSQTGKYQDGETLREFTDERAAIEYAQYFTDTHENEFEEKRGGVCVMNERGTVLY